MFGKEVFGGFGRNFFNPALVGRCFVYICFPAAMTTQWAPPAEGWMGAAMHWSTVADEDAITSATPITYMLNDRLVPSTEDDAVKTIPLAIDEKQTVKVNTFSFWKDLFLGRISGSLGVTSALLTLLGGLYLFYKKIANRTTILSVVISFCVFNLLMTWIVGPPFYGVLPPLLGAGFLFGAFFMATDPVSSPKTHEGRIFYGILIGICAGVIGNFSIFNSGLMFAILLGNMYAPIIDYAVNAYKKKKKAASAGREAAA
jgi:Na+-transporting NADH:ubiquinone oxidoreductase subunit B